MNKHKIGQYYIYQQVCFVLLIRTNTIMVIMVRSSYILYSNFFVFIDYNSVSNYCMQYLSITFGLQYHIFLHLLYLIGHYIDFAYIIKEVNFQKSAFLIHSIYGYFRKHNMNLANFGKNLYTSCH